MWCVYAAQCETLRVILEESGIGRLGVLDHRCVRIKQDVDGRNVVPPGGSSRLLSPRASGLHCYRSHHRSEQEQAHEGLSSTSFIVVSLSSSTDLLLVDAKWAGRLPIIRERLRRHRLTVVTGAEIRRGGRPSTPASRLSIVSLRVAARLVKAILGRTWYQCVPASTPASIRSRGRVEGLFLQVVCFEFSDAA